MEHLSKYDIDFSEVCTSKSRLLTFLGNNFGELLTSFCVDRNIGTVFHRTKADIYYTILHANSSSTAPSQPYHTNILFYVNEFGWRVVEGSLEIDWDDFEQVKESVRLLLWGM